MRVATQTEDRELPLPTHVPAEATDDHVERPTEPRRCRSDPLRRLEQCREQGPELSARLRELDHPLEVAADYGHVPVRIPERAGQQGLICRPDHCVALGERLELSLQGFGSRPDADAIRKLAARVLVYTDTF